MNLEEVMEIINQHFDRIEGNWVYGSHFGVHHQNSACESEPKCEPVFVLRVKD